nr:flagellin [uncultured Cohaesibacter sp.]
MDDIKTAAIAHAGKTATVTSTADAGYTSGTDNTVVDITINGTNVVISSDLDSGVSVTASEIADKINEAKIEGVTASADASGKLTITSTVNPLNVADGTSGFDVSTNLKVADTTDLALSSHATASYTNSGTEDQSGIIMIDGTKVEITAAAGATITAQDMVDQINQALTNGGNYTVSASLNSTTNQIELTSLNKGANATVVLSDYDSSGGLSLATLGLTEATYKGTTTAVGTTGAEIVVGSTSADTINLSIESLTTKALGIGDLNVSTKEGADKALSVLDTAIETISNARAEMGASMSRFEFRSAQIDTSVENLDAAKSAIADVDIAKEQASLSSSSVKVQAAVAAASQANQMPQNLLSLLK